jgi:GntR family transcriptional regulator
VFILNPNSPTPIYRQLVEQIRRMVAGGQLPVGTELPSVRELALQNAVNPMTISKAYSLLEGEGLLARQRGKPMMIAAQERTQAPRAQRLAQLDAELDQLVLSARQLDLTQEDLAKAIRKKWSQHDE